MDVTMSGYRVRSSGLYGGQEDLDESGYGLGPGLVQQASTFHSSQNGLNTIGSTARMAAAAGAGAIYSTNPGVQPQQQPMQAAYSSSELHRFSQGADRYTTNVS